MAKILRPFWAATSTGDRKRTPSISLVVLLHDLEKYLIMNCKFYSKHNSFFKHLPYEICFCEKTILRY